MTGRFFISARGLEKVSPSMNLDARLSVADAALYFKLSKATINMWYVRGHLKDVTLDAKGRRLYILRELLDAERATRRSPNSSRSLKRRGFTAVSA